MSNVKGWVDLVRMRGGKKKSKMARRYNEESVK
jgi:hypothetical protein